MNEFIEQFLLESRELVEQATDDLLALEEHPGDSARLDSAFRAFHTLKGGAGIVDFAAMERALHVAEDVLAAVRAGSAPVTPALIGDCLTCLDQVVQWLDAMQGDGELPPGADAQADAVIARFQRGSAQAGAPDAPSTAWLDALLANHSEAAAAARTAIRYRPDPGCFFEGEDPLALMADIPGLLTLDLLPDGDWPDLDNLDPFTCHMVLTGLSAAPPGQVDANFRGIHGVVDILPLGAAPDDSDLPSAVFAILQAQILLLGEHGQDGLRGRIGAAGRAAANALRSAGRSAQADHVERTTASGLAPEDEMRALAAVIQASLASAEETTPDHAAPAVSSPQETSRSLRVDTDRVDALVKLAGELTVVKNALGHAAGLAQEANDPKALAGLLKDQHALLDRLVGELQRSVLSIRVVPLRQVFQRFPRLVREISTGLGKPARLITEGEDTEADKTVVEALFEPLLHVLRNALDHGVERARGGKPPVATLHLRASRQGEHVVVELEDDGAGVDVARVRQVAADRGVASADALSTMDDEAVVDLIFAPGFSTATEVTGLSGRGVGMDAVRSAVERLGGRVRVESRAGHGTTVRFTLPFTVMITRVMTVEAGGQAFGVPLEAVVETVRIPRDRIAPVGAARAFVLRDRTIPLIDLAEALGEARDGAPDAGPANVVIASVAGALGGLEVDRFGERMDVMLKPMEGLLAGMPAVAGTTLLGDGRVLIVLDLQELLQ